MNEIFNTITENITTILLILSVFSFIFLITSIVLILTVRKQTKRIEFFFGSRSNRHNIEQMLLEYLRKVEIFDDKYKECMSLINDINERMTLCVQKVGIVRFNPFDSMGGDLSFALAILDEHNDGLVLSTLHGRDASYTYAKPINDSQSKYALTSEELEAIKKAIKWKPIVGNAN